MKLDLHMISEGVKKLGFLIWHESLNRLDIEIAKGLIFTFKNSGEDNSFGFAGTPWHSHDKLVIKTNDNRFIEFNGSEIIKGIRDGVFLLYEQYDKGVLTDRWLIHKDGKNESKFIEAGEEIRIRRYPFH